jgi:hypothetical protein
LARLQQFGDEAGPAGLVRCADAASVVAKRHRKLARHTVPGLSSQKNPS